MSRAPRILAGLVSLSVTAAGIGAGCGTSPPVVAPALSLRKVVIYRNGIGYFERGGRVESDTRAVQGPQGRGRRFPGDAGGAGTGRQLGPRGVVPARGREGRSAAVARAAAGAAREAPRRPPAATRATFAAWSCRSTARSTICRSATSRRRPCGAPRTGWSSTRTAPACRPGASSRTFRARTGRTCRCRWSRRRRSRSTPSWRRR